MSDAFVTAYTSLDARMKMVDVIANNLANAKTTGFKRDFAHVLSSDEMVEVSSKTDFTSGDFVATGNDLDVAIHGNGFFAIDTPTGTRYTRVGSFAVSPNGDLITKDGMRVLSSTSSTINVGVGNVKISDGGVVSVDGNEVGTLKLVNFRNPELLEKEGQSRLVWNGAAEDIQDAPEPLMKSGYLEQSNVNAVQEMSQLIAAYRDFESAQRVLKTLMTDMNSKLIQELGKLT
jgi:flagellar basal body rod protein FlgG